MGITKLDSAVENVVREFEYFDLRAQNLLSWMTAVGLGAAAFYLTFLFQMRNTSWLQESWAAKFALAFLIASTVIGFLLRCLVEFQETARKMLAVYPVLVSCVDELDRQIMEVEHSEIAPVFSPEKEAQIQNLKKERSKIKDGLNTGDAFIRDLSFISARFKATRLLKWIALQGAVLIVGSAFSLYVFWGVVFSRT